MTSPGSPPCSPCAAVRMPSVVAGYGGGVCLSMRWGRLLFLWSVTEPAEPWRECSTLI